MCVYVRVYIINVNEVMTTLVFVNNVVSLWDMEILWVGGVAVCASVCKYVYTCLCTCECADSVAVCMCVYVHVCVYACVHAARRCRRYICVCVCAGVRTCK